eukprot:CAMPEP_0174957054 /NCGR_PEP_ID=MMETSP0004_2-20121128/1865_1 /TAXON_ID=420556 /ORGANISM="Ochromonas sp., Strain CCMP1393" /LENGTH=425 /DNA_ID=CAMNT_0016205133 /DNA_START=349 /DNA_END=1623 /DNA_ORIENTATION=-
MSAKKKVSGPISITPVIHDTAVIDLCSSPSSSQLSPGSSSKSTGIIRSGNPKDISIQSQSSATTQNESEEADINEYFKRHSDDQTRDLSPNCRLPAADATYWDSNEDILSVDSSHDGTLRVSNPETSTKNLGWTSYDDTQLLRWVRLHGNQWQLVVNTLNETLAHAPTLNQTLIRSLSEHRTAQQCSDRFKIIVPPDWKTFGLIARPDEEILQLCEHVRKLHGLLPVPMTAIAHLPQQRAAPGGGGGDRGGERGGDGDTHAYQYDGGDSDVDLDSDKDDDDEAAIVSWPTIACLMNVEDWRWTDRDCRSVWRRVRGMSNQARLGPFSPTEDAILVQRVEEWFACHPPHDTSGLWSTISAQLKRDYRHISARWRKLNRNQGNRGTHSDKDTLGNSPPSMTVGHGDACCIGEAAGSEVNLRVLITGT